MIRPFARALVVGCFCALVAGCSTAAPTQADPAASSEPERVSVEVRDRTAVEVAAAVAAPAGSPAPNASVASPRPAEAAASAISVEIEDWTKTPVVADDASALAKQLVMAERAVRDPSVTGDKLAWMGHLQQLVYRRLLERPAWRPAVFNAIPADLRAAADFNIAATADLRPTGRVGVTKLPAWRIVAPPPIEDLLRYYREAQAQFGVDWSYLAAIHLVETRMGRIRGLSYAGAQGPMQFMPATWAAYGKGDVNDAHDAILAAGRYLKAAGAPKDMVKAIWAYNHDDSYVDAVMKYAAVMRADPTAYRGYYGWQVYFITATAEVLLPVGFPKD